jgi:hypothetical protein
VKLATAAVLATATIGGVASAAQDWGQKAQDDLAHHSEQQFGFSQPLESSSDRQVTAAQAQQDPTSLVTLAKGLKARVVATTSADSVSPDMIALFPNETNPRTIIECNEEGTNKAGLLRIDIATGGVDTLLRGTSSCDGVRRTPWGTAVFNEEVGTAPQGRVYELLNPTTAPTGTTLDRATGTFTGPGAANYAARPALGRLAFEGMGMLPSGVTYYGDENRPSNGTPGGALFKFVPTAPWSVGSAPIATLASSPYAAGKVYGMKLGAGSNTGQGSNTGRGTWVPMGASGDATDVNLRTAAATAKLTGLYRPEDIDVDLASVGDGRARICGNNTGNEEAHNFGETWCLTDGTLAEAATAGSVPELQYLVMGSPEFNMPDNIAYQAGTGNWVVHEDAETTFERPHNNDLWDCLDDGADADLLSDGCVRMGTLNDLTAEWTGGIFDATGTHFYVSVQHNISGVGVILDITGFKH